MTDKPKVKIGHVLRVWDVPSTPRKAEDDE
jgi:hypothetical protein